MIAFILPTSVLSFRPSPRSEIFALLLTSVFVRMLCLVAQLCPTLCNPMGCSLPGSSVHGDFPGKNIGVGCHSLLQGIFPTQRVNLGLLQCRQNLYYLSHQGIAPSLFQYRGPVDRCACSVMADSATPWAIARQAPLSMGFSRQEPWSGLPFPSPGSFLTQAWNPCLLQLLHWWVGSLPLVPPGKLSIEDGSASL